jgi:hypothetical protein
MEATEAYNNMAVKTADGDGKVFGFDPDKHKLIVILTRLNHPERFQSKNPILAYAPSEVEKCDQTRK